VTSHLVEFHEKRLNASRATSLGRDPLGASGLGIFGRAIVSVGAFQLSLFSFVYSPFSQSSPFFSKIMKLTQIWK